MVLIKNNGKKNVELAWEQWNYVIESGETKDVSAVVAQAIEKRFEKIERIIVEVKEIKPIIEKPIESPKKEDIKDEEKIEEASKIIEENLPKEEVKVVDEVVEKDTFSSQEKQPLESKYGKKTRRRK